MYYLIVLLIALVSIDQLLKYLVITHMTVGQSIIIVPHYFYFTYLINPGAAFGILVNYRILFILASVILLVGYIYFFKKIVKMATLNKIAITMLIGGAIGNMLDRIRINGVVDFMDFRVWPVFNFADICICIGAAILIYSILMGEGAKK